MGFFCKPDKRACMKKELPTDTVDKSVKKYGENNCDDQNSRHKDKLNSF